MCENFVHLTCKTEHQPNPNTNVGPKTLNLDRFKSVSFVKGMVRVSVIGYFEDNIYASVLRDERDVTYGTFVISIVFVKLF